MPRRRAQRRSPSPDSEEKAGDKSEADVKSVPQTEESSAALETSESVEIGGKEPLAVLYCAVCSFPPEYCEFGSHLTKCKAWLQESHPDLFEKYYSETALIAKAGALSLEAAKKLEEDSIKKEAKAEAKAESAAKKRASAKVTIKRIERNKRKHITAIHGLEAFDIDLKKAAKVFAQKFATGASVTKNAAGQDEIVVQGDVSDEVEEMLEKGGGALGPGIGGDSGVDYNDTALPREQFKTP
ncbi:Translation machinery-associated protein 22 [Clathrus columnatus]|uniref:Translation machinery-associated protein 22 n=1 Tax=Clathrus columnatus TaxID=1419009 RepID=A0AAV5ANQ2_9AGAM|nr:Translation machinery-associated protein 22 [Clathrus columnatus]